eukprot:EG_transcript_7875
MGDPGVETWALEVSDRCRLKHFCKAHCRDVLGSTQGCVAAIKRGDVSVNGTVVEDPAQQLDVGDTVHVAIRFDAIAAARDARPVEVVYEDGDLAVVWKPSGMAAVGPQPGTLQLALPHCLSLALDADSNVPTILNAVPRGMAGLTIVAKSLSAQQSMQTAILERRLTCTYRLVVSGRLPAGCEPGEVLDLGTLIPDPGRDGKALAEETGLEPRTTLSDSAPIPPPSTPGRVRLRRRLKRQLRQAERLQAERGPATAAEAAAPPLTVTVVDLTPSDAMGPLATLDVACPDPAEGLLHGNLRRRLLAAGLSVVGTKDAFTDDAAKRGLQKQKFFCTRGLYMALISLEFPHPASGQPLRLRHDPPDKFGGLLRREAAMYRRRREALAPTGQGDEPPLPASVVTTGAGPDFLPLGRPPNPGQTTTADTPNRLRDKQQLEEAWKLPEFGTEVPVVFRTAAGQTLAVGYDRVLYGDHGPYVEFAKPQLRFEAWTLNAAKRHPDRFYDEWFADDGRLTLYDQLRPVTGQRCPPAGRHSANNDRLEGYADYVVGKYYLALSDRITVSLLADHPTSHLTDTSTESAPPPS